MCQKRSFCSKLQKIAYFILLLFFSTSLSAINGKWQSHQKIVSEIEEFVAQHINLANADYNLAVNSIDPRLHLRRCEKSLDAFLPANSKLLGRSTVGIQCKGSRPWKIYLPIQITVNKTIIVSAHPLVRGQIIAPENLTTAKITVSSSNTIYYSNMTHVIGKLLVRSLGAGKALKPRYLKAAKIVKRGQVVTLTAVTSAIQVIMSGKALADGAIGDVIRVQNPKTRRIVEGIVTKVGTVQVQM